MAKKERERYTERARPYRKDSKSGDGVTIGGDTWRNPAVLIALLGLVLAVVLALGFLIGKGRTTSTAQGGTPQVTAEINPPTLEEPTAAITGTVPAGQPTAAATSAAKQYTAPEDQKLDAKSKSYFATIETPHGPITMELWPQLAPQTVNSFVFLARQGFYDGLTFHRVVPDFVIQGGDPQGTGQGGPGYSVPAEFNADNPVPHRAGALAMARATDPNSAGSQFYIVTKDGPSATGLNGQYTVFGWVTQGMNAVRAMQKGDVMSKVTIEEKPIADQVVSPDDIRQGKLPKND
jgi:cyclophilin family peptidyl-prolyl cis-trans isomerase